MQTGEVFTSVACQRKKKVRAQALCAAGESKKENATAREKTGAKEEGSESRNTVTEHEGLLGRGTPAAAGSAEETNRASIASRASCHHVAAAAAVAVVAVVAVVDGVVVVVVAAVVAAAEIAAAA